MRVNESGANRHDPAGERVRADGMNPDSTTRPMEGEHRLANARRFVGMLVPVCILVSLLTACPTTSDVGELDVVIVGLPSGTDADVTVTGPDAFARTLTESEVLADLPPGSYDVAAGPVGPYIPVAPDQDVDVVAGSRTEVDVIYQDTTSALHECTPYVPTSLSLTQPNAWTDPFDVKFHDFTAPGDPGGGQITVTLATSAPVEPWLTLRSTSDPVGAIASSGASETSHEHERRTVFEAAPGQGYEAEVFEFIKAPVEQHPWAYTVSWSYSGVMDCYEPNDTFDDAKYVPLGLVLEAYAIAGYRVNGVTANAPQTYDWYRFELATDTHVELELLSAPSDNAMNLRLFDAAGGQVDSVLPGRGNLFTRDFGTLAAGTWYLEFHPDPEARQADPHRGEVPPEQLTTPYQFRLNDLSP